MAESSGSGSGSDVARQYRTLLPAESEEKDRDPPIAPPYAIDLKQRTQTKTACRECQKKKTKCTGERPTCVRCRRNRTPCSYEAEPDTTRYSTIKKRLDEMQQENEQLLSLFDFLRSRPEEEAFQILKRIRTSDDSYSKIYETITQADLLLNSPSSIINNDEGSSRAATSTDHLWSNGGEGSSRDVSIPKSKSKFWTDVV